MKNDLTEYRRIARIHDLACEHAQALRDEAVASAWHELDLALTAGADRAERAARRFVHRLQRHRLLREAAAIVSRSPERRT